MFAKIGQLINLVAAVREVIPRDVEADLRAVPENNFHGGFERRARQFIQWLGENDYDAGIRRLQELAVEGRHVWFVGHSLGGAVAIVVTLSLLERSELAGSTHLEFEQLEKLRGALRCVTFGAPMVQCGGDKGRENNAKAIVRNFVHVDDPVPRILVAPLFTPCNFPCLRWLRKRLLQYQPLGTYCILLARPRAPWQST